MKIKIKRRQQKHPYFNTSSFISLGDRDLRIHFLDGSDLYPNCTYYDGIFTINASSI